MDLRSQSLLEELESHEPEGALEREALDTILRFVRSSARPFDRSSLPGHVTGSAVIARPDGSAFLLVRHRKLERWLQPGGHCDPDDGGVLATALREAQEETGVDELLPARSGKPLDVDVHPIPARGDEPPHLHHDVRYLVVSGSGTATAAESEVDGIGWFTLDEALALGIDPSLARALRKAARELPKE